MRSYFAYMGSKAPVAELLASLMPDEADISFMDLFCGAGNLFFGKTPARVNILNDIDADVINTHEAVLEYPDAVTAEAQRLPISRLFYEEIRRLRDTAAWSQLSKVERAARTIYLFGCAFNANPRSPFVASPMAGFRFSPAKDLRPYSRMLQRATLECLHWSAFLDRYLMKQKKLRCLLMADPPYVVTASAAHYRHRFGYIDHILLAHKLTLLNELNGRERSVRIMITYDDDKQGFIRALYRPQYGWHLSPLAIRYAAGRHTEKTNELLITNYPLGENL